MKIYISTIAFLGQPIEAMITLAQAEAFSLEFSSALAHRSDMIDIFNDYPFDKLAHNYFPAPEIPFVLNLGSTDEIIRQRSIEHCKLGLELTAAAGAPFFAAHAGFCIDPRPEELGKKLKQSIQKINRSIHWDLFIQSIHNILERADELNVDFYIENNVTAAMNLNVHGQNPLLCSTPKEMSRLIEEIPHPRLGLLLDTAHLKVSAKTLSFDLETGMKLITPNIKAIHHSDNEGILDNNQPLKNDYWFLEFISQFSNIPHVLEVKQQGISAINKQCELLESYVN